MMEEKKGEGNWQERLLAWFDRQKGPSLAGR